MPTCPNPLVSVVIPAYNVTAYITDALASVFAQTRTDYEVIVVNDGCPDTVNLERSLAPYLDRIVYVKQPNGGPSAARNAGVLAAKAPLVALLDGDDEYLPAYLERQTAAFADDPALVLIYPDMEYFGATSRVGARVMDHTRQAGPVTFESLLEQRCTVLNCAMIRRDAIVDAGMWDPALRHSEDFDLYLRIARRGGRLAYDRTVLARLRKREGSLSFDPEPMFAGQLVVYRKVAGTLPPGDPACAIVERMIRRIGAERDLELGKRAFASGAYAEAAERFASANRVLRRPRLALASAGLAVAPQAVARLDRVRRRLLHG